MKNVYFLLKLNRYIRSPRVKNLGIYFLHLTNKRYLGIFLDPVLACNLRCRMCYFSDPEKRKTMKGVFDKEDIVRLADALFHRALKLQIGCGAEPSLFAHNREIIRIAKEKKVPYISMTTNANLFSEEDWWQLVEAGLDEVTLSVHGVTKESYEYFMEKAVFEKFHSALATLTEIKKKYPSFQIRLNYTVNKDNLDELQFFFDVFGNYLFDILQIRPIQQIGNTDYHDFSWKEIYEHYDFVIEKIKSECKEKGITCIAPAKNDLIADENENSTVVESTYCYVSPKYVWKDDFNLKEDDYESYAKRTHLGRKLLANVFRSKKSFEKSKKKLNYEIK